MSRQVVVTREVTKIVSVKVKPFLAFKVKDNNGKDQNVYVLKGVADYEFFIPNGKTNVSVANFPIRVLNKFAKEYAKKNIIEIAKMMGPEKGDMN